MEPNRFDLLGCTQETHSHTPVQTLLPISTSISLTHTTLPKPHRYAHTLMRTHPPIHTNTHTHIQLTHTHAHTCTHTHAPEVVDPPPVEITPAALFWKKTSASKIKIKSSVDQKKLCNLRS